MLAFNDDRCRHRPPDPSLSTFTYSHAQRLPPNRILPPVARKRVCIIRCGYSISRVKAVTRREDSLTPNEVLRLIGRLCKDYT